MELVEVLVDVLVGTGSGLVVDLAAKRAEGSRHEEEQHHDVQWVESEWDETEWDETEKAEKRDFGDLEIYGFSVVASNVQNSNDL